MPFFIYKIMNYKVINKKCIKHNLAYYRSYSKDLVIMVKANAYGHGMEEIARVLAGENVKLGVATINEAERLRRVFKGNILIVEPLKQFDNLKANYEFVIEDLESLKEVVARNLLSKCYLKINVGMNRFGFKYSDLKTLKKVAHLVKKRGFKGLMTHFSCLEDKDFSLLQYERFCKVKKLFGKNISSCFGGSGATMFEAEEYRVGIGFYGYENPNVKPILQVKGEILRILQIKEGEEIGYGNKFVAKKKMKVGIISLGYGDGVRRDLSGSYCLFNGEKCQIIGKVCMDCLFVDMTDKVCKEGDFVSLERADMIAKELNTISYEALTSYSSLRGKTIFE